MRIFPLMILVLLVALVPACGDEDTQAAEDAVRVRLEQLARGEYAEAWQTMHPAHQAIASQEKYVECGRELALQRDPAVESIAVLGSESRRRDVTEIGDTEVVTVEVELRNGDDARRPTFDVIEVDGEWRWILNDASLRAFGSGACPA